MSLSAGRPAGPPRGGVHHDVVVTFLDGTELRGTVETFDPQRPTFLLYSHEPGDGMMTREIGFQRVKMISFLRNPAVPKGKVVFPSTARLVTVRFLDHEIYGVTQCYGGARTGLYLVPTALEEVERIYVPVSAIREVVAKRLGEILTEQGMVTPEMVEQALKQQERLRREQKEPIGQILLKRGAITDQELAQGLALQAQRPTKKIGEILIEQGFIDQVQLDEALEVKRRQGDRDKKIGEILVEMGAATSKMIGIALAIQYNVSFLDLSTQSIDPQLRTLVPTDIARRWQIMPVSLQEQILTIAVADPREHAAQDALRDRTGLTVITVVATPQDISRAIARYYGS